MCNAWEFLTLGDGESEKVTAFRTFLHTSMNGSSLVHCLEELGISTPPNTTLNFAKHSHVLFSFDPHENIMISIYERGETETQRVQVIIHFTLHRSISDQAGRDRRTLC